MNWSMKNALVDLQYLDLASVMLVIVGDLRYLCICKYIVCTFLFILHKVAVVTFQKLM